MIVSGQESNRYLSRVQMDVTEPTDSMTVIIASTSKDVTTMSRRKQANPKPVKRSDCEEEDSRSPRMTTLEDLTRHLRVPTEVLALTQAHVTSRNGEHEEDMTSVCSVMPLPKASSFGPYPAEVCRSEGRDDTLEFESASRTTKVSISPGGRWLTLCVSRDTSRANCRAIFDGTAVWCEITEDIAAGERLVAHFTDPYRNTPADVDQSEDEKDQPDQKLEDVTENAFQTSPSIRLMYECQFCNVRFSSVSTLHAHMTHYCSMKPTLPNGLEHRTHTHEDSSEQMEVSSPREGEPNEEGDIKQEISPTDDVLHSGKIRHKRFRCSICPFATKKLSSLNRHKRSHVRGVLREKQSPQAMTNLETYCNVCNIQYSNLHTYQAHKRYYCQKSNSDKMVLFNGKSASPSHDSDSNHGDGAMDIGPTTSYDHVILQQPHIVTSAYPELLTECTTSDQLLRSPPALYLATPIVTPNGLTGLGLTVPTLLMQPVPINRDIVSLSANFTAREHETPLDLTVPKKRSPVAKNIGEKTRENHVIPLNDIKRKESSLKNNHTMISLSDIVDRKTPNTIHHYKPHQSVPFTTTRLHQVSKCSECNIVFYKHENYIAHKEHYCPEREHARHGSTSPNRDLVHPKLEDGYHLQQTPPRLGMAILKFHCVHCKIPFSCPTTLEAHRNFYCPFRLNKVDEQEKRSPERDKPKVIKCDTCLKVYQSAALLDSHKCETSEMAVPVKCPHCDFSAITEARIIEHAKIHAPTKVYKCSLCGYRGNTMRGMRMHGKVHTDYEAEFTSEHVVEYEVPAVFPPSNSSRETITEEEELMRLKNLPYKRRRSRKFIEKSEHYRSSNDCHFLCPICYRLCDSALSLSVHLRNHVERASNSVHSDSEHVERGGNSGHSDSEHVERGGNSGHSDSEQVERGGNSAHSDSEHVERGGNSVHSDSEHVERGGNSAHSDSEHVERGGNSVHSDSEHDQMSKNDDTARDSDDCVHNLCEIRHADKDNTLNNSDMGDYNGNNSNGDIVKIEPKSPDIDVTNDDEFAEFSHLRTWNIDHVNDKINGESHTSDDDDDKETCENYRTSLSPHSSTNSAGKNSFYPIATTHENSSLLDNDVDIKDGVIDSGDVSSSIIDDAMDIGNYDVTVKREVEDVDIEIKSEPVDNVSENNNAEIDTPSYENKIELISREKHEDVNGLVGLKYCDKCNIKFTYLSTFRAHKKYYCTGNVISVAQVTFA